MVAEVVPGATAAIDAYAEQRGWVCEQHPDLPWPHDECIGPGMIRDDAM